MVYELIEQSGLKMKYMVGTMIETPRAAVTAGDVAKEAEFFSFGTNDLTQMTYGFSRLCDEDGKSRSISAWKAEADAYLKRNETRLGGDTE